MEFALSLVSSLVKEREAPMNIYLSIEKTQLTVAYEVVDLRQLSWTNISSVYDGDIYIYVRVSLW